MNLFPDRFARVAIAAGVAAALLALPGCRSFHFNFFHHTVAAVAAPKSFVMAPMIPVDLTKVQPNEAGTIPILEYHDIVSGNKIKDYSYPSALFRQDIQWLYDHNYRPISLSDMVNGIIDVPAGMSPVVLTFDDALRGQFTYTPQGTIDPNCVVGILDAFHALHPDWINRGTFFVLTNYDPKLPPPFYQADSAQAKMDYLVKEGYEIGDHTVHHRMGMNHWPDARVESEFAGGVAGIHAYLPNYNVQLLALPYGIFPKNRKLVISGESGGITYHNICALRAGYMPAPSPMSPRFNPYYLPRIIPANAKTKPGGLNTIMWWLNQLEKDPAEKFVSDGDPNTYTVTEIHKSMLSAAKLKKDHFHLRTYAGTQVVSQS